MGEFVWFQFFFLWLDRFRLSAKRQRRQQNHTENTMYKRFSENFDLIFERQQTNKNNNDIGRCIIRSF